METKNLSDVEQKYYNKGFDMATILTNEVNVMGVEREITQGFIDGFIRSHRTLQQNAGRVIYSLLKALNEAYLKHHYDQRNEALCEFAAKVIKQFPDEYFPFI